MVSHPFWIGISRSDAAWQTEIQRKPCWQVAVYAHSSVALFHGLLRMRVKTRTQIDWRLCERDA